MRKSKPIVTRDAVELAAVLGLSPVDGAEIQLRSDLNDKIIEAVRKTGLTHGQVAKLARTSRSRITAILNRNTKGVSTDLMLRIVASLGYRAKLTFSRAA
ncbi:MAG TPA: XRE family transcriptional regulator [Candidatus Binatia bacterium]|nr:XRE family transcriptional regulator [Candidatus Binatia bacterium]